MCFACPLETALGLSGAVQFRDGRIRFGEREVLGGLESLGHRHRCE